MSRPVLSPSKYALVICWREPLTFNVKLNRERARGRLVPRARLRGVPLNSSRGRITLRIESKRVRSRCYGTGEDESDSLRLRIVGKIGESRLLPPFSCSFVIRKRTIQFYLFAASIFSPELVECETLKTETSNVRSVVATDPKNGCSRKRPVRHRVVHQRRLSLSLSRASQDFPKALVFREKTRVDERAEITARDEMANLNLEMV